MAGLLSLNIVVPPRDIAWKGRTVRAGVWKDATPGRRRVGRLNVDGDGTAISPGMGGSIAPSWSIRIEILPVLAGTAPSERLRLRTIRRELHRRRPA